jgi:hypothetical protein
MPADPIGVAGGRVDLSRRIQSTNTVVASPAAASETIVASLTIVDFLSVAAGVLLEGFAALTIGTSGTSCTMRIRQTNVGGTIVGNTGALNAAATNLIGPSLNCFDASPVLPGQTYVLTLTIAAGVAPSTVTACQLLAIIV